MSPSPFLCSAKMASEFPVSSFVQKHSLELPDTLGKLLEAKLDKKDLSLLKWEEIGDGNLNFVYRIWLGSAKADAASTDGSEITAVIKFAPEYIRCLGPAYLLTQLRLELEYKTMCCFHKLQPFCVPAPFFYDKEMSAVLMQDLSGYQVMRSDLNKGVVNTQTIENVMTAIGTAHRLTLKESLGDNEHKTFCETFKNTAMVSITELYVFVKPYRHEDDTNKQHPLLNEEALRLRSNKEACQRAESMKKLFLEARQCLCHGDLHTGSVMTHGNDAKMFDLEFAFMGPATFDFGTFLANIVFSILRHHCLNNKEAASLLQTKGLHSAITSYTGSAGDTIVTGDAFIRDTCGFIGCELIRRVLGAAHVSDLDDLPHGEFLSLQLGQDFLQFEPKPNQDLMAIITELLTKRL